MNRSQRHVLAVVVGFMAGALAAVLVPDPIWGFTLGSAALIGLIACRLGPDPWHRHTFGFLNGIRTRPASLNGRAPRCARLRKGPASAQLSTRAAPVAGTRLEAMRRDCVANALHELCTPVTVLAGLIDGLRPRERGSSLPPHALDSMEHQCSRMRRIIDDLMQLATLESTPAPPSDERVNVGALLKAIHADAVALSAARHRVVLEADPGFDLVGAGAEIATAFSNLASNAVRYTPAGGQVRLIWRASPSAAEFIVEDTGIGIAEDHIPRLTERFFRVSRERSRENGGTGLGLAIVKDVLDRHQAALEIRSEPGRGSRFTARFPARRVAPAAVPSPADGKRFAEAGGSAS